MEATTTRLFTTVSRVTWAAASNSAAVLALSPVSQSKAMLLGALSHTLGAPGRWAVARSVALGSRS